MPRWLLNSLLTVLAWGVWGVLSKALPADLPADTIQALSTVGILPIMAALWAAPGWKDGDRKGRGSLVAFAAGVAAGVGNMAYYHALAVGGNASQVSAVTALYPVAAVALALVVLRENPRPVQWLGVAGSLAAIYLLGGGAGAEGGVPWLMYVLPPIGLWGVAALLSKVATLHVSAERGTFWFLMAFVPLAVGILGWEQARGSGSPGWGLAARDWLTLAAIGTTYGLGNLTVLAAYRGGGKASIVTPLCSLYPVVTIPLAVVFFHERVGAWEAAGIGLALVSAVALSAERAGPDQPSVPQ